MREGRPEADVTERKRWKIGKSSGGWLVECLSLATLRIRWVREDGGRDTVPRKGLSSGKQRRWGGT